MLKHKTILHRVPAHSGFEHHLAAFMGNHRNTCGLYACSLAFRRKPRSRWERRKSLERRVSCHPSGKFKVRFPCWNVSIWMLSSLETCNLNDTLKKKSRW
jgi:hypothetical protein